MPFDNSKRMDAVKAMLQADKKKKQDKKKTNAVRKVPSTHRSRSSIRTLSSHSSTHSCASSCRSIDSALSTDSFTFCAKQVVAVERAWLRIKGQTDWVDTLGAVVQQYLVDSNNNENETTQIIKGRVVVQAFDALLTVVLADPDVAVADLAPYTDELRVTGIDIASVGPAFFKAVQEQQGHKDDMDAWRKVLKPLLEAMQDWP